MGVLTAYLNKNIFHALCIERLFSLLGGGVDIYSVMDSIFSLDGAVKLALGSLFGFCLGLTGVGGGVLLIPMLQVFCGMKAIVAVGTASIIASAVKISASIMHIKKGNVEWRAVKLILLGSAPVLFATTQGIIYINTFPNHAEKIQIMVQILIVFIMVVSLFSVLRKYRQIDNPKDLKISPLKRKALVPGALCGFIMGSTGVGGGVLLLPTLNTLLGIDIKRSVGSSIVLALCLSMLTALSYSKGGQTDWETAIIFVIGAMGGLPIASLFLGRLTDKSTYMITLIVIFISLVITLLKTSNIL